MSKQATTVATGNRRLLKLAQFLKTVPAERFNMGVWVGDDWKGDPDLSCGTSACALGWATVIPEFRRLGLRLVKPRGFWGGTVRLGRRRLDALRVAGEVFAIDIDGASQLFGGGGGQTPKTKAREIEQFVEHRQKVAARA